MIVTWFNNSSIPCKRILLPYKVNKENIEYTKSLSKVLYKKEFTRVDIR